MLSKNCWCALHFKGSMDKGRNPEGIHQCMINFRLFQRGIEEIHRAEQSDGVLQLLLNIRSARGDIGFQPDLLVAAAIGGALRRAGDGDRQRAGAFVAHADGGDGDLAFAFGRQRQVPLTAAADAAVDDIGAAALLAVENMKVVFQCGHFRLFAE